MSFCFAVNFPPTGMVRVMSGGIMQRRIRAPASTTRRSPFLSRLPWCMVVEDLAVLGQDGRKGGRASVGDGDAVDPAGDVLFVDAGLGHVHGRDIHLIGRLEGVFDLGDLLLGLDAIAGRRRP